MASDTKFDQHLEEGLLPVAANEKGIPATTQRPSRTSNKMTAARRVLLTVLVCGLMTLGLASAIGHRARPCTRHHQEQVLVAEGEAQDPAKVDLIHRLLHAYFPDRYQDGVYPSDKDAIAAFEADDAELASALGQLAKRQDNGTTTPSATPTPPATDTPSATETPSSPASSAPPAIIAARTHHPHNSGNVSSAHYFWYVSNGANRVSLFYCWVLFRLYRVPSDDQWVSFLFFLCCPFFCSLVRSHYGLIGVLECVRAGYVYFPFCRDYYCGRDHLVSHDLLFACVDGVVDCVSVSNTRQTPTTTGSSPRTTSFSEVRSTFTSTASNGEVVLVTATSFVAVNPEPAATESSESSSSGGGGLQNVASPVGGVSVALPLSLAAFVAGAMLLL
ncbi:hypothetical protein QIS74_05478 [Colletotrichum tabaci]|uniref:Uncharacterized protein n=1 Tax=Colletotrichum tabaci TaxID=1209068 RepID=A0AAV9THJ3_9PEZI